MNNVISKGLVFIAVAALTACGSTPYVPPTEYPLVTVHSEEMYEWNKDYSYAKNISMMVRPSGKGFGVDDEKDPEKATNNQQSGLNKVATAVAGFGLGGITGMLAHSASDDEMYEARIWTPILVDFVPVSDLPNPMSKDAYLTIRNVVSGNIRDALLSEYPSMEWRGAFFNTGRFDTTNTLALFYGETCGDAYNLGNQKSRYTTLGWQTSPSLYEPMTAEERAKPYCSFSLESSITGKVLINGVEHWAVATQTDRSPVNAYYMQTLNKLYSGHILNPKSHEMFTRNGDSNSVKYANWNNPYPYVSHKGDIHLFDMSDTNTTLKL